MILNGIQMGSEGGSIQSAVFLLYSNLEGVVVPWFTVERAKAKIDLPAIQRTGYG